MKKVLFLLVFVLSYVSCNNDKVSGTDRPIVNVTVKVTYHDGEKGMNRLDVGSIVYLFEGFTIYNGGDWRFSGNGTFISAKWGTSWPATKVGTVGEDGYAKFYSVKSEQGDSDQYNFFTIVIASNANKNKESPYYAIEVFNIENKDISLIYSYGSLISLVYN